MRIESFNRVVYKLIVLVAVCLPEVVSGQSSAPSAKAIFDETEKIIVLAPANQALWARRYANHERHRATAADIRKAVRESFPNDPPGMQAQTSLLAALIVSGDLVVAIEDYVAKSERDMRPFSRLIVKKLDSVRHARSTIIRNFARAKPPRAYAGKNPETAARAQDRAQRYTQFVQVSTQMMNELQNTERELMDVLTTMQRNIDELWDLYRGMVDSQFRPNGRIMNSR